MSFSDYIIIEQLLSELDDILVNGRILFESQNDFAFSDKVDAIGSPTVKAIFKSLGAAAMYGGKKANQLGKLITPTGISELKSALADGFFNSSEIKYITRKLKDPTRYKGYSGFEQFITDLKEDNPKLLDNLKRLALTIVA